MTFITFITFTFFTTFTQSNCISLCLCVSVVNSLLNASSYFATPSHVKHYFEKCSPMQFRNLEGMSYTNPAPNRTARLATGNLRRSRGVRAASRNPEPCEGSAFPHYWQLPSRLSLI